LRGEGVESEVQLPYAALHQLLYPALDRVDDLPALQSLALRSAFGLASAPVPDRFLVAVAALTLISDLAADTGLVCLVDNAHWLDQPSADALLFIARRLQAEGIALLFAAREGETHRFSSIGLPECRVRGLSEDNAVARMTSRTPALPATVMKQLIARTGGNPMALLELPSVLTAAELAGEHALPEPLPAGRQIELAFAARAARLDAGTRTLLLVTAAEETGDLAVVLRAAGMLGVPSTALDRAERAGLLRVNGNTVSFRHPLARSAIYQHATFAARRAAHEALAGELHREQEVHRRAWHLAATAVEPDSELAAALADSADRARRRAGPSAAAAALERSAALTPEDSLRGSRLLAAADAAWAAGAPYHALSLLSRADPLIVSGRERAALLYLRGLIELRCGVPETAYELLLRSAAHSRECDPRIALEALVLAGEAASFGGDRRQTIELGRHAAAVRAESTAEQAQMVGLLVGVADAFSGDWQGGTGRLRGVVESGQSSEDPVHLLRVGRAAIYLGDDRAALTLHARAVDISRRTGAISLLPVALERFAFANLLAGRFADTSVAGTEGLKLAHDMGQDELTAHHLLSLALVAAWRGEADACRGYARQANDLATSRRLGLIASGTTWALGLLELGLGRPTEALKHLTPLINGPGPTHPAARLWATPDWVEAAARAGEPELAIPAMREFESWADMVGLPWARAVAGRCKAILIPTDDSTGGYLAALTLHDDGNRPHERARTELVYGEALRRARMRTASRIHLRAALAGFEQLGAAPWAERARAELRASGETTPSGGVRWDRLTVQELQIAQLAARGASNPEIAGQLFLSRRTIEYHLHKVFTKLGLASRAELARAENLA
jgi:DNA-binding CsgD family transcriptional regulator